MNEYFRNFPRIEYNAKICRNILSRPRLKESLLNSPLSFYNYVIEDDARPDQVAAGYYNDPEMMWLIFLANDIIDPYHQWPLTYSQFIEMLVNKYGSQEQAKADIKHYQHRTKDTIISKETYELHTGGLTLRDITNDITSSTYKPVTCYEYEDELNTAKRTIRLVDYRLASKAGKLLKSAMKD
tara:strand:+ start:795 stop:1343 length:549 start_codon:yes stop_codon:yes gene_type:complete